MPPATRPRSPLDTSVIRSEVVERVSGLLDRWIARAAAHVLLATLKKGEPAAIVLPADEYEALLETLEIMEDEETQRAIIEGEQDLQRGKVKPYEEVRRDLGLA
jgi:antitoxin YefM